MLCNENNPKNKNTNGRLKSTHYGIKIYSLRYEPSIYCKTSLCISKFQKIVSFSRFITRR